MDLNEVPRITCEDLKRRLESQERLVIIDSRSPGVYQAAHIKGAVNIYYEQGADPTGRQLLLSALPPDLLLVPYCD